MRIYLMNNHFHLVLETPRGNLSTGMQWFLGSYTVRFNRRHKLNGHLFAGRYKSLMIDATTPGYLRTVCDYVHLNPVRAGLLTKRERLQSTIGAVIQAICEADKNGSRGCGMTVCLESTD
jgi:REP element-mobilizing transposase RayT